MPIDSTILYLAYPLVIVACMMRSNNKLDMMNRSYIFIIFSKRKQAMVSVPAELPVQPKGAEKKHNKEVSFFRNVLLACIGVVNLIYIVVHVPAYLNGKLEFWDYVGFGFFTCITAMTYKYAVSSKEIYADVSTVIDIFGVNLLVQLAVCYSRKGWYLYFLVVGYAVYKGVRMLLDCVGTADEDGEEEEGKGKGKKKRDRRQEREERQKVKYVKH